MKEFILVFRHENAAGKVSPEQMQIWMKQTMDWIGGIAAQNKFIGGNGLIFDDAKVVGHNGTATILEWKPLLQNNKYKDEIIKSLQFLVQQKRMKLYAFVIMSNHIHLIWQPLGKQTLQQLQLSFMKFTAQQIKFDLQKTDPDLLEQFRVNAKDRTYQFWERNALSIELRSVQVFNQKLNYIHHNPVKAGICTTSEAYYYSSAEFYASGTDVFSMLTHCNE